MKFILNKNKFSKNDNFSVDIEKCDTVSNMKILYLNTAYRLTNKDLK